MPDGAALVEVFLTTLRLPMVGCRVTGDAAATWGDLLERWQKREIQGPAVLFGSVVEAV